MTGTCPRLPYDPLNYDNLAQSIVRALLDRSPEPLAPEPFRGPGVYAVYHGGHLAYPQRSHENTPVYVGKAVPPGSRTGTLRANVLQDRSLHRRLREHEKSVTQAENDTTDRRGRGGPSGARRSVGVPILPISIRMGHPYK